MAERPEVFERTDKDGARVPFVALADALAADKVEFGKANTPTDQAVAMAQAILNRK